MPIKPSQAALAALALIAAPAFAQDGTAPATPETAPAETPAEAPASPTPAMDAPAAATDAPAADAPATATDSPAAETAPAANAEPQVGQYYVKETHQDWTTRCLKAEQGKDPCELYQLLKDGDGNSVAEMTMIPLRNSEVAAGATLVAPLETDLVQGLGFGVGTAEPRGYPFNFCAPVGCVSRMGFTQAELDGMKRGANATVTLLPFGADRDQLLQAMQGHVIAKGEVMGTYAQKQKPPK